MPFEPFYERFGEIARRETRSISVFDEPRLAGDEFGFLEAYCNDDNCDCRRVIFNVVSRKRQEIVAVIAYGWETESFYARWYRQNDPDTIRQLQGPILNPGSVQSELAPALLEKVREVLLADPAYIARLKRHYWMFKEKVDPKHFSPFGSSESETSPKPIRKKKRGRRSRP